MELDIVVHSRPDREIRKKVIKPGDFNLVPYEDAKCKINITDIVCTNDAGKCEIEPECRLFSPSFDGDLVIGDSDHYIDKDFELIVQQMCNGEVCLARIVYMDDEGKLVKQLTCKVELMETTNEDLISDWDWLRLYSVSMHHKECGVELVKEKRIADAFRRFSKALKLLIAVEPIDPELIPEGKVHEMIQMKVKLYNNLSHCQLQYNEYDAALDLCNRALKYDPNNVKSLYRRCVSYIGLEMYEDAWNDIQKALSIDPSDKAAQQKANFLKPKIEKIKNDYANVIKKMFG